MKNLRYCKLVSLFLSIILVLSSVSVSVGALVMTETEQIVDTGTTQTPDVTPVTDSTIAPEILETETVDFSTLLKPGEKTIEELQAMTVDLAALPEVIQSDVALAKGHVNRLKVQEQSLNTVIYQNSNGTKSTYIFAKPVKYIDGNGEIKDKSSVISSIVDEAYSYAMLQNCTKVYFPKSSQNAMLIQYGDHAVSMKPVTTVAVAPSYYERDGTVIYNGVFGENTLLVYNTELNGLKEDIILVKNIGKSEFDFELTLTNLTPVQMDGTWYLQSSQGEVIGEFGSIVVKDSAGNTVIGSMAITATAVQGKYDVKITAPEEFLNASTTRYPVYVDPTTYIWETGGYTVYESEGSFYTVNYDAITDTGVYDTSYLYGVAQENPGVHYIGESPDGTGAVLYRFYDFFGEHGAYKDLLDVQIGSAQLYVDTVVYNDTAITAYPVSVDWLLGGYEDPIAVEETGILSVVSTNNSSSVAVTAGTSYQFVGVDVTQIVRGWARYNQGTSTNAYENPENGLLLNWGELIMTGYAKSVESSSATDNVYMVLDTSAIGGNYYLNNMSTNRFLRLSSNLLRVTTSLYEDTDYIRWYIDYLGNNQYCIRTMYDTATGLCVVDNGIMRASLPTELTAPYIWNIQTSSVGGIVITSVSNGLVLRHNGSSTYLSSVLSSTDTNYKQTAWGIIKRENYVHLTDFELNDDWLLPSSAKTFTVVNTPTNASCSSWQSCFTWSVSNTNFTVDENGQITSPASGGVTNLTVTHKATGLSKTFRITSGYLKEDTYLIVNVGTGRQIEIEGASTATGAYIQQGNYSADLSSRWQISLLENGEYVINLF